MTGYGRGEATHDDTSFHAEVKTWNSRFVDVNVRLPHTFASLENRIATLVKERIGRGKVDVNVGMDGAGCSLRTAKLNANTMSHYFTLLKTVKNAAAAELEGFTLSSNVNVTDILGWQGVVDSSSASATDAGGHDESIVACVENAIREVILCREKEGMALHRTLVEILGNLAGNVQSIDRIKHDLQNELYDTYHKRLDALLVQLGSSGQKVTKVLPEDRLLAEVAILTDKADISEEIARLDAHVREFGHLLDKGGDVGRKLDFLCQELHREANTISSKVVNIKVSHDILDMKQNIEKLRQQVQNIE